MKTRFKHCISLGLLITIYFFTSISQAQTTTGASTDWHNTASWDTGIVPSALDDVVVNHTMSIFSSNASANSVIINNADLTTTAGTNLAVATNLVLNSTGTTDSQLSVSGSSTLNVAGDLTVNQNTTSDVLCRVNLDDTAILTVGGNFTFNRDNNFAGETSTEIVMGTAVGSTAQFNVTGDFNVLFNSNDVGVLRMTLDNFAQITASNLNMTSTDNADPINGTSDVVLELLNNASVTILNNTALNYETPITTYNNQHEIKIDLNNTSSFTTATLSMSCAVGANNFNNWINVIDLGASLLITGDITFANVSSSTENRIACSDGQISLGGFINNVDKGSFEFLNSSTFTLFGSVAQVLPRLKANTYYQNLIINNTSGINISMYEIARVNGDMYLINGIINASSTNPVRYSATATSTTGSSLSFINGPVIREGAVANTDFIFPVGNGSFFNPMKLSNIANADNSTLFTIEYLLNTPNSSALNGINNIYGFGYWDIVTSGSAPTADVTLFWEDACSIDIPDITEGPTDLVIANYNTGTILWDNTGVGSITTALDNTAAEACNAVDGNAEKGSITMAGITNFGFFTFGSINGNNPLPVILTSFSAKLNNNTVLIEWTTSLEFNSDYFSLERASDNLEFKEIYRKTSTNSNEESYYYYIDVPSKGGNNYYRLKQVDTNGDFEYSKTISLQNLGLDNSDLIQLYPNPLNFNICENLKIEFDEIEEGVDYEIELVNSSGLIVHKILTTSEQSQILVVDLTQTKKIEPGLYTLLLYCNNVAKGKRILIL